MFTQESFYFAHALWVWVHKGVFAANDFGLARWVRRIEAILLEARRAEIRTSDSGGNFVPRTIYRCTLETLAKVRIRRGGVRREARYDVRLHLLEEEIGMFGSVLNLEGPGTVQS